MIPLNIAAIIPVYNRQYLIIDAIKSVLNQTLLPKYLIIVDDGSTDATVSQIEHWFKTNPADIPIKLIKQKNGGASSARNHGVCEAGDCQLIAFLDSDDLWPDDYLQSAIKLFEDNPQLVAASSNRIDKDYVKNVESIHNHTEITRNTTSYIFTRGSPGTPNTVLLKKAFEKVGGYDVLQMCGEDYQLFLRISLLGQWGFINSKPVEVRRNVQGHESQAPQLSRQYNDRRLRLARILDQFIHEDGGYPHIPESQWRQRIGQLYFTAGRNAIKSKDWNSALESLNKARKYRPFHIRTKILHVYLKTLKNNCF